MALLDLSLVTDAMVRLLKLQLPEYGVLPAVALSISGAPPDLVKGDYALSCYLYHVREEAHTKSQDWGTESGVPQRFKPMGLALYYVLSARSTKANIEARTVADQQMMGLAIKAFHDHPTLTDASMVDTAGGPQQVFQGLMLGGDNKLRLHLMPVPASEAQQYWQAGTDPTRLSAYYEVCATLLEPEELRRRSSRVLTLGVHAFAGGTPRIFSSDNIISFTAPGDPAPRDLRFSPAEVTYLQRFTLRGANLKGDSTRLILNTRRFAAAVAVDPIAWQLQTNGSDLSVQVQTAAAPEAVFPGIYTATVVTVFRKQLPDGSWRDFEWISNAAAISIVPRITALTPAPANRFVLTVPDFNLTVLNPNTEIQLFVGAARLDNVGGAPAAGQFQVQGPGQLRFRCPAGSVVGDRLPVRLIVLGAENAPLWVTVP